MILGLRKINIWSWHKCAWISVDFDYFTAVSANDSTQDKKAPEAAVNSSEFNKVKNPAAGTDLFSPVYFVTLTNIFASAIYQFSWNSATAAETLKIFCHSSSFNNFSDASFLFATVLRKTTGSCVLEIVTLQAKNTA